MQDTLHKYLYPDNSVRILSVNLSQTWRDICCHQQHPEPVQKLLGELTAAAVLLASNIKFEGSLLLQLQGQGAISLMVVECSHDMNVRATVKLREGKMLPSDQSLQELLNADGQGRFAVILDLKNRRPGQPAYQGIVHLEGKTISDVLATYMYHSEQLETRLKLACSPDKCSGLLLQKLPNAGGHAAPQEDAEEHWQQACRFLETVTENEQLEITEEELIHRLFWEQHLISSAPPTPVRWHCTCSREKVCQMLRQLGAAEVQDIIEEKGHVEVQCEFCGTLYTFDAVDAAQIFIEPQTLAPESPLSH